MAAMSSKQTSREYERLLADVFGLLIHCGIRHRTISALTKRAFKSAIATARASSEFGGGELATFSLVLDAWHRNRRYLTSKGNPKAVPLFGRSPSVEALIRTEAPQFNPVELAKRIQSLRLVKPCPGNRYRPTGDAALVSIYDPTVLQYLARSLTSLLETVEENLRCAQDRPPLLQRSAEVPDLPADCIQSFRQFSRLQGAIFLRTINDWLETRRVRAAAAGRQKNVRAGVHVHAYVAYNKSSRRLPASAKRSLT
jgi:hypothetical protein